MFTLIKNSSIVSEDKIIKANVLIQDSIIVKIDKDIDIPNPDCKIIDANGLYLFPGIIDTHVHFREPGLTHKGDIFSESRAAAAGGVTSFIDMPNNIPVAITSEILNQKFNIAQEKSLINYSFYIGASQDNINEIQNINVNDVAGIKLFMGSSTGNLAVKNIKKIEEIFKISPVNISIHCEDDNIIENNLSQIKKENPALNINAHHKIRSNEACLNSTKLAIELAQKYDKKIIILHVSTKEEMDLLCELKNDSRFNNIFEEVCVNYLWQDFYKNKLNYGNKIKCNPAIKLPADYERLKARALAGEIDIISTDHAPHTLEEKQKNYSDAPSGIPSIQHSFLMILETFASDLTKIARLMSNNPAKLFQIDRRGFIREGYYADLVLVDINKNHTVDKSNILYKCRWSPLEGYTFGSKIITTFVNGKIVFSNDKIVEANSAMKLKFNFKK